MEESRQLAHGMDIMLKNAQARHDKPDLRAVYSRMAYGE
jgi:hypothetical protein